MTKILDIQQIHKSFASQFTGISGKAEIEQSEVLKGVNFTINTGESLALIGTNGSGKSTLFNIISGLLKPNKGSVIYHFQNKSHDLSKIAEYQHARMGIARLFQGNNIFPDLSVLENLKVADNNRAGEQPWHLFHNLDKFEKQRTEEAEQVLQQLLGLNNPLWGKRDQIAGHLSIGQQRLLAFARLFMNKQATLFLLDEPCAGVNPAIREIMVAMMQRLKEQHKTVVLVEHNLDFVEKTTDRAIYLDDGRIALDDASQAVLEHDLLKTNYLGLELGQNQSKS